MSALFLMKTLGLFIATAIAEIAVAIYPTYGSKRAIPFGCSFRQQ